MITGLQTLRMIALAAAFAFLILVLPAMLVAPGFTRVTVQVSAIGLILVGAAGAALGIRWLQLRDTDTPRTAQEFALAYRTRFFLQAAVAQAPGLLAFLMSLWARPFPGIAVLLGVACTAALVALIGPTERNLGRLEDEARQQNVQGSVRGALDEMYSWRP